MYDAFGIFLGFTANLVFYRQGEEAWKYQTASAAIPAGVLLVLIWNIPESPRWLLKRGRGAEAFLALCELRPTHLQAAAELLYANAQIQTELRYFENAPGAAQINGQPPVDAQTNGPSPGGTPTTGKCPCPTQINGQPPEHVGAEESQNPRLARFSAYPRAVSGTSYLHRISRLFLERRIRRATLAASICMIGQQLCGVY